MSNKCRHKEEFAYGNGTFVCENCGKVRRKSIRTAVKHKRIDVPPVKELKKICRERA